MCISVSRFLITWPFSQFLSRKKLKKPSSFQLKKWTGLCVCFSLEKVWREHFGLESINIFKKIQKNLLCCFAFAFWSNRQYCSRFVWGFVQVYLPWPIWTRRRTTWLTGILVYTGIYSDILCTSWVIRCYGITQYENQGNCISQYILSVTWTAQAWAQAVTVLRSVYHLIIYRHLEPESYTAGQDLENGT